MDNDKNLSIDSNNQGDIKKFFEGWEIYQKVIQNDYMLHNEVIDVLINLIKPLASDKLSILELGCGDSHVISNIADNIDIHKYCGIDISESALKFAEKNLLNKISNYKLISGDMVEQLLNVNDKYDFIIIGYSAHHLTKERKKQLLLDCKKFLNNSGKLIIYDLVHKDNESREEFLKRYVDDLMINWSNMSNKQLDMIQDHILSQDIPESLLGWKSLADNNGYNSFSCPYRDKDEVYAVMKFCNN